MSEPHTPATSPTPTADTLWCQGAGVGTAVGLAVSTVLAVGIGFSRYPDFGLYVLLGQIAGVVAGMAIGATVGAIVGAQVKAAPVQHH